MKRTTTVAATVAAAVALLLSGCSSDEGPSQSSGMRKNTAVTQTESESGDTTETAAPDEDTDSPPAAGTTPADNDSTVPQRASDTTCGDFAALDEPDQEQMIRNILDENPDSAFVDNPNAALGTAKLVCNAGKVAEQKVAVASGIVLNG